MKILQLTLSCGLLASQMHAGIQNGKIVADVVRVENASLFPIKINGAKVVGGSTYCFYFGPHDGTALSNFIDNGIITIELHDGKKYTINVPLQNPKNGPVVPYAGNLNKETLYTYDTATHHKNYMLEFDIVISSHWVFGQKIAIGKNFSKAVMYAQPAVDALFNK